MRGVSPREWVAVGKALTRDNGDSTNESARARPSPAGYIRKKPGKQAEVADASGNMKNQGLRTTIGLRDSSHGPAPADSY